MLELATACMSVQLVKGIAVVPKLNVEPPPVRFVTVVVIEAVPLLYKRLIVGEVVPAAVVVVQRSRQARYAPV